MKKKVLIAIAVLGVLLAVMGYGYQNRYASSIGIIGGADGPTAILVAGKTGMILYAGIALILAVIVAAFAMSWRKRK